MFKRKWREMLLHETIREWIKNHISITYKKANRYEKDKINHIDENIFVTVKILIGEINSGLENI